MANWRVATLVKSEVVAVDVKALTFAVEPGVDNLAGQHYDLRLTASNGYQAERSYSLASPPGEKNTIEFGVQLLRNGEVSPYLFQLRPGEQIEVRGPIGQHFVWSVDQAKPLILIGGGSGLVPLLSMLRHHFENFDQDKGQRIVFLISARTPEHVLYREELERFQKQDQSLRVVTAITHDPPPHWAGYRRRIDREMFEEVFGFLKNNHPDIYICGPTPFVEKAANLALEIGFERNCLRTERFGDD